MVEGTVPAGRAALIGAGLIGRSWAVIFARAGWQVTLWDAVDGVAERAIPLCETGLRTLAEQGLCDAPDVALSRIAVAASLPEAVANAGLVQESGPELLDAKRALFAELDAAASPDAIIASSSSAIRTSLFTEDLPGRGRCLVAHPVNPPHLIPLVELSGAPWTLPETISRARAIYEAIGQVPVTVLREVEGFVLNRLQGALLAEAFRLAAEGVMTPADIDLTVSEGLGLRWSFMGPFATIELNAPGGIPDYCARYTGFYKRLAAEPAGPEVYEAPATERILQGWQPTPDPAGKMQWRDGRLAALRAHKRSQEE
jgi:3-hydroxyacyl-CoA dehydrogenase